MQSTLVSLARTLLEATADWWPEGDEDDHFNYKAFVESLDYYLLRAARDAGFQLVGCGNFTAVFSHPEARDVVFKLNAGTLDRMEEYHRWLMQQDAAVLPRVYHVESLDGGCVAVAERLDPAPGYDFDPVQDARNVKCRWQALNEARPLIEAGGFCCDDTHPGNYMLRGDVWVVNDPHSNRNGTKSEEEELECEEDDDA